MERLRLGAIGYTNDLRRYPDYICIPLCVGGGLRANHEHTACGTEPKCLAPTHIGYCRKQCPESGRASGANDDAAVAADWPSKAAHGGESRLVVYCNEVVGPYLQDLPRQ